MDGVKRKKTANAGGWRPWLPSEERLARRLREEGWSLERIAARVGRTARGVQERTKTKKRGRREKDLAPWAAELASGRSYREIAARRGCSVRLVHYYHNKLMRVRREGCRKKNDL